MERQKRDDPGKWLWLLCVKYRRSAMSYKGVREEGRGGNVGNDLQGCSWGHVHFRDRHTRDKEDVYGAPRRPVRLQVETIVARLSLLYHQV